MSGPARLLVAILALWLAAPVAAQGPGKQDLPGPTIVDEDWAPATFQKEGFVADAPRLVFFDSDVRRLSRADVSGLSAFELRLARNEI